MRIAVIGKFYPEAFGLHIAETLDRMGHRAFRCEVGFAANSLTRRLGSLASKVSAALYTQSDQVPGFRRRRFARMLESLVAAAPFDMILETHDFLWPEEIARIKRHFGAAFAVWFPDHFANIGRGHMLNAPIDAYFFKDPFMVQSFDLALPGRCYYLPECQNPPEHERPAVLSEDELAPYRCEVATAGNMHSYRAALFSQLTEFNVRIWGHAAPAWMPALYSKPYAGRPVYGQDKVRAFAGASIVLNNLHYAEIWGVNVRAFEAAAAGAFQLIDWRPGLSQLFVDGSELVSFRGIDDLKQKIRFYLRDEEARQRIGAAGLVRARRDHRYDQRLQLLIDTLSGREKGYPVPGVAYV